MREIERDNDLFEVLIEDHDVAFGKSDVVSTLGYSEDTIPEHFDALIGRILADAPERFDIRAGYRMLAVCNAADRGDGVTLGETFFATRNIVAVRMRLADQAACFVCTIGPGMETWAARLTAGGDLLAGHLVDTVATVAVESTVDALHVHLGEKMRAQGSRVTNRYSPGYCGWPVADQHALFSLFPEGFCGVTLTESALMKPVKSVSGMIGIGPEVDCTEYDCAACGMNDCTYRKFRAAYRCRSPKLEGHAV